MLFWAARVMFANSKITRQLSTYALLYSTEHNLKFSSIMLLRRLHGISPYQVQIVIHLMLNSCISNNPDYEEMLRVKQNTSVFCPWYSRLIQTIWLDLAKLQKKIFFCSPKRYLQKQEIDFSRPANHLKKVNVFSLTCFPSVSTNICSWLC